MLITPVFIYLLLLFLSSGFNFYFLEIDSCLDRGGSWDYIDNICIGSSLNMSINIYILKFLFFIIPLIFIFKICYFIIKEYFMLKK